MAPEDPKQKFVNPQLTPLFMDLYMVRTAILRAIQTIAMPRLSGVMLDVGCGIMPYRELLLAPPSRITQYIGIDIPTTEYYAESVIRWDGKTIPFGAQSMDSAMATEVFEHCFDPTIVIREIARVLKPGGCLFFTVPFLWPLHCSPEDYYRYTPFSLKKLFEQCGFRSSEISALTGWNGALAQAIGLWVNRAPLSPDERNSFREQLFPFFEGLARSDQVPNTIADMQLSGGWTGIATRA